MQKKLSNPTAFFMETAVSFLVEIKKFEIKNIFHTFII